MRLMDYHVHTQHSFDGRQTVEELCARMLALGADEVCLTEHIEPGHPEPGVDRPPVWDDWLADITRAREAFPALTLRAGIEIGDNPLLRQGTQALLDTLPLDFRLLSLHLVGGVDCYDAAVYYRGKTRAEAYREYAAAKAESVCAWEDFDSVAHIGYVGRYAPYPMESSERTLQYRDAPEELDALLRHIVRLDKCLEINTSGYDSLGCPMPHPSIIRRYIELGGTCFTFGSDAHTTDRDLKDIRRGMEEVRALGGRWCCSFEQRQRKAWRL